MFFFSDTQSRVNIFTLKLFRILCSYGERFIDHLRSLGLVTVLKTAIFVQENSVTVRTFFFHSLTKNKSSVLIFLIKVQTVKMQIEAVRCTRTIVITTKSDELIE